MRTLAKLLLASLTAALALSCMNPAAAYVGPGAGLSLLSALWGLLAAVFAALAFVIVWPFRRMLKRRRGQETSARAETQTAGASNPSADSQSRTAGRTSI
jgi:membrane protein implicated in regulation of membrane protease activity